MIFLLIHLVHLGACVVLLAFGVYPWSDEYNFYVVQNEGTAIDAAGLFWRYAYAATIGWLCTGPIPYFLIERIQAGAPVRTRVTYSVVTGFVLLAAASIALGTNLFFTDRVSRPGFVRWMDLFLAEFHFISFMGYGLLVSVVSILTQYLLRRSW